MAIPLGFRLSRWSFASLCCLGLLWRMMVFMLGRWFSFRSLIVWSI